MFDRITIYRVEGEKPGTFGVSAFAETLLYYRHAHLVMDPSNLDWILTSIGPDNLQRLVDGGHIKISFSRETMAVGNSSGSIISNEFTQISSIAAPDGTKLRTKSDHIAWHYRRLLGSSLAIKRAAQKLADSIGEFTPSQRFTNAENINQRLIPLSPGARDVVSGVAARQMFL